MFFPGTPSIFASGDSVYMLLKCMCNNISIEKKTNKQTHDKGVSCHIMSYFNIHCS